MTIDNFCYEDLKEFDNHRLVVLLNDPATHLKGFIAIHRGGSVPAFGATRIWSYPQEIDALKDVLRLSKLMSYKAALAGLPYGGAKAVIFSCDSTQSFENREQLIRAYARRVNYLGGRFITGSDVGVSDKEVHIMAEESPYIVGTISDPTRFTGLGLFGAIQTCLKEIYGNESISGRNFAIQGVGKVGESILRHIYNEAGEIYVSDINTERIKEIQEMYPKVKVVEPNEIDKQEVDVFLPCALAHAVHSTNISSFKCKIIAGSANNQLEDKQIGEQLHAMGILYAPDFVVNAGGMIAVADEYQNKNFDEERMNSKVLKIKETLKNVIEKSKSEHKSVSFAADEMAENIFNNIV